MKIIRIISVLFLLLIVSCSDYQDVIITTKSKKSINIFLDTLWDDELKEIKKIDSSTYQFTLKKDRKFKQFIISSKGFKPIYEMSAQDFETDWKFKDTIIFGELLPFPVFTNFKQIIVDDIYFDVPSTHHLFQKYEIESIYDNKGEFKEIRKRDSLKGSVGELKQVLNSFLNQDTTEYLLLDNLNKIHLSLTVKQVLQKIFFIDYRYIDNHCYYKCEAVSEWIFKNSYGDHILSINDTSESGKFVIHFERIWRDKVSAELEEKSIQDALEYSFIKIMSDSKVKDILKREEQVTQDSSFIEVNLPQQKLANIEDAMEATCIIKGDKSFGSGFIISNDGYLITNYHVINNIKDINVITSSGKTYFSKLVRTNKALDLALLKIEGNFEKIFQIPEIKNYIDGDEVYAIGTPKSLELGQSVSKGIISGTRKKNNRTYLQTDISLNNGNSGGPIIAKDGKLIGVVEYKIIEDNTEGLSFSIPAFEILNALNIRYK